MRIPTERELDILKSVARLSPARKFRLAAMIRINKIVIAAYNNTVKTHPQYRFARTTIHAEGAALNRGKEYCSGARLYVIRIKADESLANARPCKICMNLAKHYGIREIIYSNDTGKFERLRI